MKYQDIQLDNLKTYLGYSLIPSSNNLALSDFELKRLATIAARIELSSISQSTCQGQSVKQRANEAVSTPSLTGVVDYHGLAGLRIGGTCGRKWITVGLEGRCCLQIWFVVRMITVSR